MGGLILFAQTQRGKITVNVVNDLGTVVENATIELRKTKDSSLAKIAITDKYGLAEFENILFGSYFVKASLVNYTPQYSTVFILSVTGLYSLRPAAAILAGSKPYCF